MTVVCRALILFAILAGCGAGVEAAPLEISNGSTLIVTLVVNGTAVDNVPPDAQRLLRAQTLPPLPWSVEARSPTGRVLLSFTVKAGDVFQTSYPDGRGEARGDGARADLTCGRLDVWVGSPMIGPPPDPSHLLDCAP